jgi:hypothetical protein
LKKALPIVTISNARPILDSNPFVLFDASYARTPVHSGVVRSTPKMYEMLFADMQSWVQPQELDAFYGYPAFATDFGLWTTELWINMHKWGIVDVHMI